METLMCHSLNLQFLCVPTIVCHYPIIPPSSTPSVLTLISMLDINCIGTNKMFIDYSYLVTLPLAISPLIFPKTIISALVAQARKPGIRLFLTPHIQIATQACVFHPFQSF